MIPFFRKIRKKMADDNRPLKYMRYAVGEIVLVVIGILIALQINTWNEERKDRKIEKTLLINVLKDLQSDIQEFNNVKNFKTSQNEACVRLLEYLIDTSKPLEDTIQFINDFQLVVYFIVPSSNSTAFDIAVSTGYLNNITSDGLVNELSNYFNSIHLEQHVTETKRFINAYNENSLIANYPMFSKHVMALDGQGGKYALERYRNDNRPVLQLQDIRGDMSLENYLNELSIRLTIGIIGLENEAEWAFGLIQKIQNELNSKNK